MELLVELFPQLELVAGVQELRERASEDVGTARLADPAARPAVYRAWCAAASAVVAGGVGESWETSLLASLLGWIDATQRAHPLLGSRAELARQIPRS